MLEQIIDELFPEATIYGEHTIGPYLNFSISGFTFGCSMKNLFRFQIWSYDWTNPKTELLSIDVDVADPEFENKAMNFVYARTNR